MNAILRVLLSMAVVIMAAATIQGQGGQGQAAAAPVGQGQSAPAQPAAPQTGPFTVTVVPPVHGTLQLTPPLPADGKYAKGTVVTLKASPEKGYAIDSVW